MDFVTVSTGLILPYWMGLPIRYIQFYYYISETIKTTIMVANSKMIFLMHINPIIIDSMCELSFLNKRVSLVYGAQ